MWQRGHKVKAKAAQAAKSRFQAQAGASGLGLGAAMMAEAAAKAHFEESERGRPAPEWKAVGGRQGSARHSAAAACELERRAVAWHLYIPDGRDVTSCKLRGFGGAMQRLCGLRVRLWSPSMHGDVHVHVHAHVPEFQFPL